MVSGSCALPPRWPPQCSYVVIESSFDPGERLQAPVSLWCLLAVVFPPLFVLRLLFVPFIVVKHFLCSILCPISDKQPLSVVSGSLCEELSNIENKLIKLDKIGQRLDDSNVHNSTVAQHFCNTLLNIETHSHGKQNHFFS